MLWQMTYIMKSKRCILLAKKYLYNLNKNQKSGIDYLSNTCKDAPDLNCVQKSNSLTIKGSEIKIMSTWQNIITSWQICLHQNIITSLSAHENINTSGQICLHLLREIRRFRPMVISVSLSVWEFFCSNYDHVAQ
jgi:hypothetical protein